MRNCSACEVFPSTCLACSDGFLRDEDTPAAIVTEPHARTSRGGRGGGIVLVAAELVERHPDVEKLVAMCNSSPLDSVHNALFLLLLLFLHVSFVDFHAIYFPPLINSHFAEYIEHLARNPA